MKFDADVDDDSDEDFETIEGPDIGADRIKERKVYRINKKIVDREHPETQDMFGVETIILERSRYIVFRTPDGKPRAAMTAEEEAQIE